jgi:hypothetical protein
MANTTFHARKRQLAAALNEQHFVISSFLVSHWRATSSDPNRDFLFSCGSITVSQYVHHKDNI